MKLRISMFLRAAVALFLATAAVSAAASEIPGAGSEGFRQALADWLDGKDRNALDAFAALARQDNRAAQVFLARVAGQGHLHAHLTAAMPRAERVALLRQPGGLSGKSWLMAAQEEVPLAAAFLQAGDAEAAPAAARSLLRAGETAESLRIAKAMLDRGQYGAARVLLAQMDPGQGAVKTLTYTAVTKRAFGPPLYGGGDRQLQSLTDPVTRISVADQLSIVPVSPRALFEMPRYRIFVTASVLRVEELRPLAHLCRRHCPRSARQCAAVGRALLPMGYAPFASPVQSLLPDAHYWAGPRIEADVVRRLPDLAKFGSWPGQLDACFAKTVTELQARYR